MRHGIPADQPAVADDDRSVVAGRSAAFDDAENEGRAEGLEPREHLPDDRVVERDGPAGDHLRVAAIALQIALGKDRKTDISGVAPAEIFEQPLERAWHVVKARPALEGRDA